MRFIVLIKANKEAEAGVLPSQQLLTEMGKFNEELMQAGVMLAGEGRHPSSRGARVKYANGRTTVTDGPFVETEELISGFWIWQCEALAEAIAWARRIPNPHHQEGEVEIRQIFEMEEFGEVLTPELREQEERRRTQMAAKK